MVTDRNLSIEFLKFIAVIIVANSHFDSLYGEYSFMATGGAIGDALFFFASGFTLFLGRFGRFDNWYKRRIKRIYPSMIAWAVFLSVTGIRQYTFDQIANGWTGFWFVCCIMIYYIILFFVRRFYESKPVIPFVVAIILVLTWYLFEDRVNLSMYGEGYFRWVFYFLFMLAGAYFGNNKLQIKVHNQWINAGLGFLSLFLYYSFLLFAANDYIITQFQILTLLPLAGIVMSIYQFCNSEYMRLMMMSKAGLFFRSISGLCLEAYIVQYVVIDYLVGRLDLVFPLNLFIAFVLILLMAYFIRCFGRVFSQIFGNEDFDWRQVFKFVN